MSISHYSMGKMDHLMLMATICKDYGWTYDEYMDQPNFFINLIREKMVRDQKREEMEYKKMNRGK